MKKIFTLFVAAGILAFMACGGSDKDKEQAKQDSIKKADSIAQVVEKAKQDSIKKADSIATADTLKQDPNQGPNQGPKQGLVPKAGLGTTPINPTQVKNK